VTTPEQDDAALELLYDLAGAALRLSDDEALLSAKQMRQPTSDLARGVANAMRDAHLAAELCMLESAAATADLVDDDVALWAYEAPPSGMRQRIADRVNGPLATRYRDGEAQSPPLIFVACAINRAASEEHAEYSAASRTIAGAVAEAGGVVDLPGPWEIGNHDAGVAAKLMERISRADAVVVLAHPASFGAGVVIALADRLTLPTLVLYKSKPRLRLWTAASLVYERQFATSTDLSDLVSRWIIDSSDHIAARAVTRQRQQSRLDPLVDALETGLRNLDPKVIEGSAMSPTRVEFLVSSGQAPSHVMGNELLEAWFGQPLDEVLRLGLRYAYRLTNGHLQDAEDLVGDVIVKFTRKLELGALLAVPDPIAYFHKSILYRLIESYQQRARQRTSPVPTFEMDRLPNAVFDPEDSAMSFANYDGLLRLIATLPVDLMEVIKLRVFAGMSQADTATALGVSEKTVANRMRRARDVIAAHLLKSGD
jgi:RNA polymerase sigma factor (sigma-70 family)